MQDFRKDGRLFATHYFTNYTCGSILAIFASITANIIGNSLVGHQGVINNLAN